MVQAELLGSHTHVDANGNRVHIWKRGATWIARGRCSGQQFGESLGSQKPEACLKLRQLLSEFDKSSYVPPSQREPRVLPATRNDRISVGELCNDFLTEKKRLRGQRTTKDYCSRLAPLIEFAELRITAQKWHAARSVDREFALAFRDHVAARMVSRNGRPAAPTTRISPRQIFNVLDCARSLFNWAQKIQVGKLPASFNNPFDAEIVGQRPRKDPLRVPQFPMELRVKLISELDLWQLTHLSLSFVLPLRPEDCAGLLIRDVDFERRILSFGPRFQGRDFNKGRTTFNIPYPAEMDALLWCCRSNREDGPLLRSRASFEGTRRPSLIVRRTRDIEDRLDEAFRAVPASQVAAVQDQKRLVRRTLRTMGGVTEDELGREFAIVLTKAGQPHRRFYALREAVTSDLEHAGVSPLVMRYVTGHTLSDVLHEYVCLDPIAEMQKYFDAAAPLLHAIAARAEELKLRLHTDALDSGKFA